MGEICGLKEKTRVTGWEEAYRRMEQRMEAMEERLVSMLSLRLASRGGHKGHT